MLTEKMQAALNHQITEELESAYIYLQMAAESDRLGLPGFANWFKLQYREELCMPIGSSITFWNEVAKSPCSPSPNRNWKKKVR